jgi:hypothetical protein
LELLEWITDEITILAEAFGESLSEQRHEIYCRALADISQDLLRTAFRRARFELKYFPKIAELRELAGVLPNGLSDGRPGPEEAWARMPKGERIEQDSIVWCDEERAAYDSCRSLLLNGDRVGAHMAFRERYEKELVEARSKGKPPRWTFSAGYDIDHRLSTLAAAVQANRIPLEDALNSVPGERHETFVQMLPSAEARRLLAGRVEKSANLPGLCGLLAKMKMEGTVPEELNSSRDPLRKSPADRTDEEVRELRARINSQIELLKHMRRASDSR